MTTPLLSLIIPAFNEENRLPRTLSQVSSFLESQTYHAEVLVVENGSTDRTFELAQDFARQHNAVRALHGEQRGKGSAVRQGMLAATGEYRFICDADLSMPIEELNKFLPPALPDFDVAIGSRESAGAVRYDEPSFRHWGGRLLNYAIRALILPGLKDTQCGFKCFRAAVADDLFRQQTLAGWSFDIEVLFLARRRGYRLTEIPIHWYFSPESKVSAIPDALRILADIFKIHANALRGRYDQVETS